MSVNDFPSVPSHLMPRELTLEESLKLLEGAPSAPDEDYNKLSRECTNITRNLTETVQLHSQRTKELAQIKKLVDDFLEAKTKKCNALNQKRESLIRMGKMDLIIQNEAPSVPTTKLNQPKSNRR